MSDNIYVYSVYDNDEWYKLSEYCRTEDRLIEYKNKTEANRQQVNLFSDANSFKQKYLLRYYIIKYSLMQHNSFLFDNPSEQNIKTLSNQFSKELIAHRIDETDINKSKYTICSIKSILGTTQSVMVLGILINNEEEFFLEDPTYKIKLNIDPNKVLFGKGIYCFNHILLVGGKMSQSDEVLNVEFISHPPFQMLDDNTSKYVINEAYSLTLSSSSTIVTNKRDYSSSKLISPLLQTNRKYSKVGLTDSKNLNNEVESWILLSDLLITDKKVINNLEKVFFGYEKAIKNSEMKLGFVLFGNFSGLDYQQFNLRQEKDKDEINNFKSFVSYKKHQKTHFQESELNRIEHIKSLLFFEKTRQSFQDLGNLLGKFPLLLDNCIFLLIPGPNDIGPDLLPKNPLTDYFTSNLKNKFPNSKIYLKSNPTRLENNGINMFLIRYSLSTQLKEKTLYSYFGEENMGYSKQWNLVPDILEDLIPSTILGQRHLIPTSLNVIPTLDPCFYLLPIPNVIVIGDSGPSFSIKPLENLWIINPGSFKDTNSWIQYNIRNNSTDHVWL